MPSPGGCAPAVAPLGLETDTSKRDAIEDADQAGSAFMAFFTTFGSFSIAAGILLIFLIFVMLAAERRGELGIARAIGTRRGHLVQLFLFEGAAYDVVAALVGAALGAVVAYAMVAVMAKAFGGEGIDVRFDVTARSLLIAYAIGVLLTLAVVALSAWRVSRMTVATAIRNLPEPVAIGRRRRVVLPVVALLAGGLMAVSGAAAAQATPLMLGISIVLIGVVPVLRLAGVSERLAYTGCGLAVVVLWMLPWSTWELVFGQLGMDFSTWIVSGLMVVVGAVWTIMYNAPLLLAGTARVFGRFRSLAPILRMAMAHPLAARFRTGVTLAMFTLVVFTLVTGVATSGSFVHAFERTEAFGGGFDVRASTAAATPVADMRGRWRGRPASAPGTSRPSAASRTCRSTHARAGRGARPSRIRCAGSIAPSCAPPPSRWARSRTAMAPPTPSGRRWRGGRGWRSSTAWSCPAATTSASRRCRRTSASPASSTTTARSSRSRSWRATRRRDAGRGSPSSACSATPHRRTCTASRPRRGRWRRPSRGAPTRRSTTSGRPRRRRRPGGRPLESAFLANGMQAESIEEVVRDATAAS